MPALLVGSDAITTVGRAEEVARAGRIRDTRTGERMRELLAERANVGDLLVDG